MSVHREAMYIYVPVDFLHNGLVQDYSEMRVTLLWALLEDSLVAIQQNIYTYTYMGRKVHSMYM